MDGLSHLRELVYRLREFGDRPLPAGRRRVAAGAVAVCLFAAALVLIALANNDPRPAAQPAPVVATAPVVAPQPPVVPDPAPTPVTPRPLRDAKAAARQFLRGYLAYTYGQTPARRITGASVDLRRDLAALAPRVPASERHRRARITVLQLEQANERRAALVALIDDGRRSYSVRVVLDRDGDRWHATTVSAR